MPPSPTVPHTLHTHSLSDARCVRRCLAFLEWLRVCVWGGAGEAVPLRRLLQTILRLRACTDAAQWEGETPAPARYQPHTTLLCTTGIWPRAVPVSCRRAFEIDFLGCSLAVWSGRGQIDIDRVWSFVLQKWVTQQVMMDPPSSSPLARAREIVYHRQLLMNSPLLPVYSPVRCREATGGSTPAAQSPLKADGTSSLH